ncbi:hypothetical protein MVEN_00710500 [Mycena venus]|uniref:Uncharacterized protein n=1 Tax=Mycena venus TaxID=2733690 RepID=A0A8H6YJH7_9AGAR|nr:hypothetical protein MVEN_00710500 [Mycena venus]
MNLSKQSIRPNIDNHKTLPSSSQPDSATAGSGVDRQKPRQWEFHWASIAPWLAAVVILWVMSSGLWIPCPTSQHRSAPAVIATTDIDTRHAVSGGSPPQGPPLYGAYHSRERNLPQHNLNLALPYPRRAPRNISVVSEWGSYLQEMILDAYLAYASERAYVFDNYTLEREGAEIISSNGHHTPARIPLSAFISGPIAGAYMHAKNVPRAVSREFYQSVCPESDRVVIDTRKIQASLGAKATVSQIIDRWVTELHSIKSRCVELAENSPPLFGYEIMNTDRVLDVFPALSKSPILARFGWSPLVLHEFYKNVGYFASSLGWDEPDLTDTSTAPLRGLLVLHIPRGDYGTSCHDLDPEYSQPNSFAGLNNFRELPDKYLLPKLNHHSESTAEIEMVRKYCLPSIPEVVRKVHAVVRHAQHITRVYVMSDAEQPWLNELKAALSAAHEWAHGIATRHNLQLSPEGQFVAEAVDMYVAQRAEMFIANGLSSSTSSVVMLRMNNPDLSPADTHFW